MPGCTGAVHLQEPHTTGRRAHRFAHPGAHIAAPRATPPAVAQGISPVPLPPNDGVAFAAEMSCIAGPASAARPSPARAPAREASTPLPSTHAAIQFELPRLEFPTLEAKTFPPLNPAPRMSPPPAPRWPKLRPKPQSQHPANPPRLRRLKLPASRFTP